MNPGSTLAALPTPTIQKEHNKVGPIIAILVVVLILVIAALYAFGSLLNKNQTPPLNITSSLVAPGSNNIPSTPSTTQTVAPITNNADDPQSLQNDLNAATQGVDSQNF